MNNTTTYTSTFSRLKDSKSLKAIIITILLLIMLIPSSMVTDLIYERRSRLQEAESNIFNTWSREQLLSGPILTIPYEEFETINKKTIKRIKYAYLLTKQLDIKGDIKTKKLSRGIFEVPVYESSLYVSGNFDLASLNKLNIKDEHFLWNRAFVTLGFSDTRGIMKENPLLWNKEELSFEPGSKISEIISTGVTYNVPITKHEKNYDFKFQLDLKGSKNLSFVPSGKNTHIELTSKWKSPSFFGNFLPNEREVSDSGFIASWDVHQINTGMAQQWKESERNTSFSNSSFGVAFLIPVDNYSKSLRSAKYAFMTISLTFLVFFLVELLSKRKTHPIQYALVGLAISLFYTLLVSLSEHLSFNLSYFISYLAIALIIFAYSTTIFKKRLHSFLLLAVTTLIYSFVFITIQLEDFALLLGSVGLLLTLASVMYFTRKVKWYNEAPEPTVSEPETIEQNKIE